MKHSPVFPLLQSLVQAYGPCGQEDEIRDLCKKELKSLTDELWIDAAGNLIGKVKGSNPASSAVRLMVHMDELSMIVKRVHEDGSLRVNPLGGLYPASIGQGPVDILGDFEQFTGILSFGSLHTTRETPHTHKIIPKENRGQGLAPSWDDVHVITRKTQKALKEAGVRPGTRVVIAKSRRTLTMVQDSIAGYFLDNRGALAIAIETLKKIKKQKTKLKCDLYIVATCSEEIGASGACYASRTLPGDISIAIDVGPVAKEYQTLLSPQPIVVYQDAVSVYDKQLSDHLVRLGKKLKLDPQSAVFESYGSDASIAQKYGQAAQSALLCFPVENTHGYELTHKDSFDHCSSLLALYLKSL